MKLCVVAKNLKEKKCCMLANAFTCEFDTRKANDITLMRFNFKLRDAIGSITDCCEMHSPTRFHAQILQKKQKTIEIHS